MSIYPNWLEPGGEGSSIVYLDRYVADEKLSFSLTPKAKSFSFSPEKLTFNMNKQDLSFTLKNKKLSISKVKSAFTFTFTKVIG